ncbi:MAG: 50S ribosomal protein L11 methyltransferase [Polaribacter sp.]|jgi:ribosomal protein L11 methyltransferase
MSLTYIEYNFTIEPRDPATEILIAELGLFGFESFVETETGLLAYIQSEEHSEHIMNDIQILESNDFNIEYSFKTIEQTNWNEEWEKNFTPINVDNRVYVRAPFHEASTMDYEIVIEPKMSFGTGHHETTHMMIQHLLDLDVTNKSVLDMGCGTGILAIFAAMKNARPIDAIDIDEWCVENTKENIIKNNCEFISVFLGDANLLQDQKYDIIIANINRNILLQDLPAYKRCLNTNGILLLSGFYTEDEPLLQSKVKELGFEFLKKFERNNWLSLRFRSH